MTTTLFDEVGIEGKIRVYLEAKNIEKPAVLTNNDSSPTFDRPAVKDGKLFANVFPDFNKEVFLKMCGPSHICTPQCCIAARSNSKRFDEILLHRPPSRSPLSLPLELGWGKFWFEDLVDKRRQARRVVYVPPCWQKIICNEIELDRTLAAQQSLLGHGNFTFDPQIREQVYYVPDTDGWITLSEDLAQGRELFPLPVRAPIGEREAAQRHFDELASIGFTYTTETTMDSSLYDEECGRDVERRRCKCSAGEPCQQSGKCDCFGGRYVKNVQLDAYHYGRIYWNIKEANDVPGQCNFRCPCRGHCPGTFANELYIPPMEVFWTARTGKKNRGFGLRTLVDIPRGSFVGFLNGKIRRETKAESDPQNHYLVDLNPSPGIVDEDEDIVLDCERLGRALRFSNHSCNPNMFFQTLKLDGLSTFSAAALVAMRNIFAGEELTWDYNIKYGLECISGHIRCLCGESECRGFMQ